MKINISLLIICFILSTVALTGCANSGTPSTTATTNENMFAITPVATLSDDDKLEENGKNPFADYYCTSDYISEYKQDYYKAIAPDFQEFKFTLHGYFGRNDDKNDILSINTIKIYGANGEHIQTIDGISTFLQRKQLFETDFSFDDWNGDGYFDISLYRIPGGSMGNRPTYFWLWDNQIKQFVICKELEELSNDSSISLEDDNRIIAFTRCDLQTFTRRYYQFIETKLVLVEEYEGNFNLFK
jgi:hypothetical protein